jgi:hypothetical protein
LFLSHGLNVFFIVFAALLSIMFAGYVVLTFKFARPFFEKLFEHGSQAEWALYSFGIVLSFCCYNGLANHTRKHLEYCFAAAVYTLECLPFCVMP